MERFFRSSADPTPVRVATVALVTFIGTLVCAPIAAGTRSLESYRRVVAGVGPVVSAQPSDAAEQTVLENGSGAHKHPPEEVGWRPVTEGPCGALEEGQTSMAKPGSSSGPTPLAFGHRGESFNGFQDNSCTPGSEATDRNAPTAEVVRSKPPAATTATSSAGSESTISEQTAEMGTQAETATAAQADTAAVAWGSNYPDGQLGAGYRDNFEVVPVDVRGLSEIRSMVPADETSYALLDSGVVKAWGDGSQGALGNDEGVHIVSETPVAVLEKTSGGEIREMTNVTAMAAAGGAAHAMALVSDGPSDDQIMTWGGSAFGQRGNGEHNNEDERYAIQPRDVATAVPALEHVHVIAIAAGGNSDFALQEAGGSTTLWAWGGNQYGKLGTGTEGGEVCKGDGSSPQPCRPTPQRVDLPRLPAGVNVTSISSGKRAAYAVLSDGRVLAWGENAYGQLGDDTTESSDVPTYVCAQGHAGSCPNGPYLENVKAVSGGELFALALLEDGEVVGWGLNASGNLGSRSHEQCQREELTFCQRTPKVIEGLHEVTAISAGSEYGLALVNGHVYSWGTNVRGQLGDGKAEGPETCGEQKLHNGKIVETIKRQCSRTPSAIPGLSGVAGISAVDGAAPYNGSFGHSFAYLQSGSGPAPLLTVTPEEKNGKGVLQVNWSIASSPESNYNVKWKEEPPPTNSNAREAAERKVEWEEDRGFAVEWREAAEAAEAAEEAKAVKEDTAEQRRYESQTKALREEEKKYEEAAEQEYPATEAERVTETCTKKSAEWCETITQAPNGKDEEVPLGTNTSYRITLNVTGADRGDSTLRIVGTTPP